MRAREKDAKLMFSVAGPARIPTRRLKATKTIDEDGPTLFWKRYPDLAKRRGCYIFAMSVPNGITPVYVGQATRTFKQEVFTDRNMLKYLRAMADFKAGNPEFFFLLHPRTAGAPNRKAIAALERYLIKAAALQNPRLHNRQSTKQEERWGINGVLWSGVGKPSKGATKLKRMLDL